MANVGRPKEYDRVKVLDAAMNAFWNKGYEATSVSDLVEITGLHKGSLYQAFGDKHSLFCFALEHYFETIYQFKNSILQSASTPITGLKLGCQQMLFPDSAGEPDLPRGCMAINTLAELAPHDPEVERIIENHFQKSTAIIAKTLAEAEKVGEMKLSHPPEITATMLMTFLAGLSIVTKGLISKEQAQDLLNQQFILLGLQ